MLLLTALIAIVVSVVTARLTEAWLYRRRLRGSGLSAPYFDAEGNRLGNGDMGAWVVGGRNPESHS